MKAFEPNKAISCLYENTLLDHADNTNIKPFITKRYDSRGHVQTRLSFPKSVDTVKSKLAGKTKAKSEVRKIKKILLMYKSISGAKSVHFYKLTITLSSKNYRWAGNANQPTLVNKLNHNAVNYFHSIMKKLRRNLSNRYANQVKIIVSNPVIKYPKDLHAHSLLILTNNANFTNHSATGWNFIHISDVRKYIKKYLTNELATPIDNNKVKLLEPLRLHDDNTSSPIVISGTNVNGSANYQAMLQYLTYINKTDKLPVAKSWQDYYAIANAPASVRDRFVLGVLNTTTQGKRIHYVTGFKQRIKRLKHVLSSITTLAGILALFSTLHVSSQRTLFNPARYTVKLARVHLFNSTSFDKLVHGQTLKIALRAISISARLSYTYSKQTAPRVPFRIASRVKAFLTITFTKLGINCVEPYGNPTIELFNSS